MRHRLEFHAMGCDMLALVENGSETPPEALSHIPDWFEVWEQTLSRFRLDSELSRLNQTSDQPVRVSQTLWDVFQTCLQAEQFTDGLVTPTVLEALIDSGYDRPFDELPAYRMDTPNGLLTSVRPLSHWCR
jgi:thiamine biosynthesis lipoprotein